MAKYFFSKKKNRLIKVNKKKTHLTFEDTIQIAVVLLLLGVSVFFLWGVADTFDKWLKTVTNLFGSDIVAIILLWILSMSSLSIIYILILWLGRDKTQPFNWSLHITICLAITILIVGTIGMSAILGSPPLDSALRDKNTNEKIGEILCVSSATEYLIDSTITCKITKPEFQKYNSTVTLRRADSPTKTYYSENKIEFKARENTKSIYFEIDGVDSNNKTLNLHITREFKFYTEEQIEDIKEKRVTYMLALLGIILFSVPGFVINMRDIYRNKQE